MKRNKLFLISFLLISLVEITSLLMGWQEMHFVAKPLLIPLLIGYYLSKSSNGSKLFVVALLFCWAGDSLLLFQEWDQYFFLGGLVAFLIGHITYIIVYKRFQVAGQDGLLGPQKIRYSLPILLTGTGLITILFPGLDSMAIPVILYSCVLMIMVLTALFRFGRTSSKSFWMVFAGAILFMLSDSLIAINKFYFSFADADVQIMITYILAQYFIVEGITQHK
ncbi:MAG: lysoplasmalogenase [Flammeovirgaceae bacterium]|nr:lysoplasmalogenase [Flammeovirgaceae bacterium]